MRTIRVTGKGQIKLKPDMIRIIITMEGTYPEYSDTLRHSSKDKIKLFDFGKYFKNCQPQHGT